MNTGSNIMGLEMRIRVRTFDIDCITIVSDQKYSPQYLVENTLHVH